MQVWKGRDRGSVDDIFRVNRLVLFVENNTLIIFYHIQKAIENIVFPGSSFTKKIEVNHRGETRMADGKSIKLGLIQQKSIGGINSKKNPSVGLFNNAQFAPHVVSIHQFFFGNKINTK